MRDTVLSIDIGQDDCFYRILRSDDDGDITNEPADGNGNNNDNNNKDGQGKKRDKRIVYVVLKYLDLIPEPLRSSAPDVIRILSQLPAWPLPWKTLTVRAPSASPLSPESSSSPAPRCDLDEFPPHALSPRQLFGAYPSHNILHLLSPSASPSSPSLSPSSLSSSSSPSSSSSSSSSAGSSNTSSSSSCLVQVKTPRPHKQAHRSFRVAPGCFLKIARFAFEIPWLAHEIHALHILAHRGESLAPRVLGYAYEETPDRVVGLLTEELAGRRPGIEDLEACRAALRRLHDLDIVHGDVARGNMFVTEGGGVKFIDLEEACVGPLGDEAEWEARKREEMSSLAEKLMTEEEEDD